MKRITKLTFVFSSNDLKNKTLTGIWMENMTSSLDILKNMQRIV